MVAATFLRERSVRRHRPLCILLALPGTKARSRKRHKFAKFLHQPTLFAQGMRFIRPSPQFVSASWMVLVVLSLHRICLFGSSDNSHPEASSLPFLVPKRGLESPPPSPLLFPLGPASLPRLWSAACMYGSGGGLFGYNDQRPATSLASFFFLFSFTSPSLLAVPSLSISFAFAAGTRNGERRWQRGGWSGGEI